MINPTMGKDGKVRDEDLVRTKWLLTTLKLFPLSREILIKHIKDNGIKKQNGKPYSIVTYMWDLAYMTQNGYVIFHDSRYGLTDKGRDLQAVLAVTP